MDQSFNSKQLVKLVKDIESEHLGLTPNDFKKELDLQCANILNGRFEFEFFKSNGNIILSKKNLAQKIVLRKLNHNIKKIYKDEQANRRIIISQIKILLSEECPFWIVKTDIKNFYESISRERIIRRLKEDAILSYHSISILGKIFSHPYLSNTSGLPRGLNISSTLSEYYMRKFDKWATQFGGVYYYARFVDDIIILTNNKTSAEEIYSLIDKKLEELSPGLIKNEDKTFVYGGQDLSIEKPLSYLGYKFYRKITMVDNLKTIREQKIINNVNYSLKGSSEIIRIDTTLSMLSYIKEEQKVKSNLLQVGIAESKIKKIKSRIVVSFLDFIKTSDFNLLEKRIKFLTGNYPIRKSVNGNELRAGIYYNYEQINNYSDLEELDRFYRKMLFSKRNSLGGKIDASLSLGQKITLKKYSFIVGFERKIYNSFKGEMEKIVELY